MTTHPDLPAHLRAIITCDPSEVLDHLLVFADFVEECCEDTERADLVRGIVAGGPVEVEPVPPLRGDDPIPQLWSYAGPYERRGCACGMHMPVNKRRRANRSDPSRTCFRCNHCNRFYFISSATSDEAAREMLHRLRVRCLVLWREELFATETNYIRWADGNPVVCFKSDRSTFHSVMPRTDPRWPPLPCPRCNVTMCRCERCGAEQCHWHDSTLHCVECGHDPSGGMPLRWHEENEPIQW